MSKSYKDATSRHSAKNSGQNTYVDELYGAVAWGSKSEIEAKEATNETSAEPVIEEKIVPTPVETKNKEEILNDFKDYANQVLDESSSDKVIQGGVEIERVKTSTPVLEIKDQINKENLINKMIEQEGSNARFSGWSEDKQVKIMFITKSFLSSDEESSLEFPHLRSCFDESAASLFERMILAMNLDKNTFYVSATEDKDESSRIELLKNEIKHINPTLIICLGAVATNLLLDKKERLARIHGQLYDLELNSGAHTSQLKMMPLFHPEYLLINPNMKKLAWDDMQKAMQNI